MNKFICILLLFVVFRVNAQVDDLESMLEDEMGETTDYAMGTFLSTFVLNGRSVEILNQKGINFRVSHKFGALNSGVKSGFGFDHINDALLGVEYGVTDWVNVGLARTTYSGSLNGMLKFRLLRQSTGGKNMPLTLCLLAEADYYTGEKSNAEADEDFAGRFEYTTQLMFARKIGHIVGVQLMPTLVHRNLVETIEDKNSILSVGLGATAKVSKRFYINAEYFWVEEHNTTSQTYYHPISIGISHQTSRHTFELFGTNAQSLASNNFIGRTTYNFWEGDIVIGFNISIIFTVKR